MDYIEQTIGQQPTNQGITYLHEIGDQSQALRTRRHRALARPLIVVSPLRH